VLEWYSGTHAVVLSAYLCRGRAHQNFTFFQTICNCSSGLWLGGFVEHPSFLFKIKLWILYLHIFQQFLFRLINSPWRNPI